MSAPTETMRSKADRAFRFFVRVFWIGFVVSALFMTLWIGQSGPEAMQQGLRAAEPWLTVWRILLFAILIGGWRVAAWLLLIEVLLVQGVVTKFFADLLDGR